MSSFFSCYLPTCRCAKRSKNIDQRGSLRSLNCEDANLSSSWQRHCGCTSSLCRRAHKQSYWHHPKLRQLLARLGIRLALQDKRTKSAAIYHSFAPKILLDNLPTGNSPLGWSFYGAFLFADINGFTSLTEKFSSKSNGAEELCDLLNNFFSILIDIVKQYGGDVVKFAGDAVSVVWRIPKPGKPKSFILKSTATKAMYCAWAISQRLKAYCVRVDGEDIPLGLHISVTAGLLNFLIVGGIFDRWEYVLGGRPIEQLSVTENLCRGNKIILSREVWDVVKTIAKGKTIFDPLKQRSIKVPHSDIPTSGYVELKGLLRGDSSSPAVTGSSRASVTHKEVFLLRRYIPAAVQPKLAVSHLGFFAEARHVSVLFIRWRGVNLRPEENGSSQRAMTLVHEILLLAQHSVYYCEGSINKLAFDDKGLHLLCVFGLPPLAHGDDPARCIRSAITIQETFSTMDDIACSIGVASGPVICGVIGSKHRQEYTVMGDAVNLSARLMSKAKENQILVDNLTKFACDTVFKFKEMGRLKIKGFEGKIDIFSPTNGSFCHIPRVPSQNLWNCRQVEHETLLDAIKETSGVFIITAVPGVCKSAFTMDLDEHCKRCDAMFLEGVDLKEQPIIHLPVNKRRRSVEDNDLARLFAEGPFYTAWNGVFEAVIARLRKLLSTSVESWIQQALPDRLHPFLPLLNILASDLKFSIHRPPRDIRQGKNPRSRRNRSRSNSYDLLSKSMWELTKAERCTVINKMVIGLLMEMSKLAPIVILLHLYASATVHTQLDAESWTLARLVAEAGRNQPATCNQLLLVLTLRPLTDRCPIELVDTIVTARQERRVLHLKPLGKEKRTVYLWNYLELQRDAVVPQEFLDYVSDNACGIPKHIEGLVTGLIQERAVAVAPDRITLLQDLNNYGIPAGIVGVAMSQIDGMTVMHQLVVKIASNFLYFSAELIERFLTCDKAKRELPLALLNLVDSGVFVPNDYPDLPAELIGSKDSQWYSFESKLLQRQAHSLLLASSRRSIEAAPHNTFKKSISRSRSESMTVDRPLSRGGGSYKLVDLNDLA